MESNTNDAEEGEASSNSPLLQKNNKSMNAIQERRNKKMKKALLIATSAILSACTPAPSVAEESGLLQNESSSSSESVALTSYEGESRVNVYEVYMDRNTGIPEGAKYDISFKVKNGEPIVERGKYSEYQAMLHPDLTRLGGGSGAYSIHCFYYDFECTSFVNFSDIATKEINLFYYAS